MKFLCQGLQKLWSNMNTYIQTGATEIIDRVVLWVVNNNVQFLHCKNYLSRICSQQFN